MSSPSSPDFINYKFSFHFGPQTKRVSMVGLITWAVVLVGRDKKPSALALILLEETRQFIRRNSTTGVEL
jgi:hypothetical protein